MPVLEALSPQFSYRCVRQSGAVAKYRAARRVVSTFAEPVLLSGVRSLPTTWARLENKLGTGSVARLEDHEYNRRSQPRFRELLTPALVEYVGDEALRDMTMSAVVVGHAVAGFHVDLPYQEVILGAWHVGGPPREVHFPEMGLVVPFRAGSLLLFDAMQPHAMLPPGTAEFNREGHAHAPHLRMLSLFFMKRPVGCSTLGIDLAGGTPAASHRQLVVCHSTGRCW